MARGSEVQHQPLDYIRLKWRAKALHESTNRCLLSRMLGAGGVCVYGISQILKYLHRYYPLNKTPNWASESAQKVSCLGGLAWFYSLQC